MAIFNSYVKLAEGMFNFQAALRRFLDLKVSNMQGIPPPPHSVRLQRFAYGMVLAGVMFVGL